MTDKEREAFKKTLEEYKEKFAKDSKAARDFFIKVGILTKKGTRSKHYKNLCIPQGQD